MLRESITDAVDMRCGGHWMNRDLDDAKEAWNDEIGDKD